MSGKKVIIIGAGVGGTATAARLAQSGFDVTVIEKNDFSGGRCSLIYDEDGHRFDRGPSLYLMPKCFEETFEDLGEKVQDWLDLRRCDPNYRVHFHDGECIELSSDLARMKTEVERFEGVDGYARFLDFVKESHYHYELSISHVLHTNFTSLSKLLKPSYLLLAFRLHILNKLYGRAAKYFWSERLRRAFTFQTMYMGMSPFDAPATYNLLQYTELAEGIFYPVGGFNKVVQSLEELAKRSGAKFRYSSPVAKIDIDPKTKKANGVILDSGERISADIVICNADLIYTYNKLLPSTPYATKLSDKNLTSSSISFYWSMKQVVPELDAHNIFLAEKYKDSFDDIFKRKTLPEEASFYVNVPSRMDKTAAPEGRDTIVVLIPTGYIDTKNPQNYETLVTKARAQVLEVLETRLGISNFKDLILRERTSTPLDWQNDFNLHRGSILGLSHDIFQVLYFRPSTKHADYKNLYFVGASTQPGTGVPIVLCGARMVSEQVCGDYGVKARWLEGKKKEVRSGLDKVNKPGVGLTSIAVFVALIAMLLVWLGVLQV
ncbi:hypothetical protein YB2330_006236 [Saitoella coloradoensis]